MIISGSLTGILFSPFRRTPISRKEKKETARTPIDSTRRAAGRSLRSGMPNFHNRYHRKQDRHRTAGLAPLGETVARPGKRGLAFCGNAAAATGI